MENLSFSEKKTGWLNPQGGAGLMIEPTVDECLYKGSVTDLMVDCRKLLTDVTHLKNYTNLKELNDAFTHLQGAERSLTLAEVCEMT